MTSQQQAIPSQENSAQPDRTFNHEDNRNMVYSMLKIKKLMQLRRAETGEREIRNYEYRFQQALVTIALELRNRE